MAEPSQVRRRGGEPAQAPAAGADASPTSADAKPLNPRTTHYEFSGPYVGPIGIIFGLPTLTWAYSFYCNASGWPAAPESASASAAGTDLAGFAAGFKLADVPAAVASTWDVTVFGVYVAYWSILAALYFLLPGRTVEGTVLRNGKTLRYPMNGLLSLVVTLAGAAAVQYFKPGGHDLTWLYDRFPQVVTATIVFSFLLSFYLYAASFLTRGALLAEGGNSGRPLYDFFIGRELNPRLGGLDLKFFNELRPGLTQWLLINLACCAKAAAAVDGDAWALASSYPGLLLVTAFEGYYVLDSVLNEESILSTMDIIQDGFGFMLAFGDLAWVPALYSLQARFLVDTRFQASPALLAATLALALVGMWVFRSSNSQKDTFKKDPRHASVAALATIPTHTGKRLLAGGWWGMSRHINYLGDWLMSVAWCLPCGFASPLPYFYPLYFAVLLIHRERRDDEKCAAKYGEAWLQYRAAVPWRIVPYIY